MLLANPLAFVIVDPAARRPPKAIERMLVMRIPASN